MHGLPLRRALRGATQLPLAVSTIEGCLDEGERFDVLFRRARRLRQMSREWLNRPGNPRWPSGRWEPTTSTQA